MLHDHLLKGFVMITLTDLSVASTLSVDLTAADVPGPGRFFLTDAARHEGKRAFYRLANEHASQMGSDAIFQAEHSLGGVPRHHHPEADSARRASA